MLRSRAPAVLACLATATLSLAGAAIAQLDGGDRGVAPIDSSANIEVTGVQVDVSAKTADQARTAAWREAQRRGWAQLWARTHGTAASAAPKLADGTLDAIVSGIEIEEEHAGPTRYIARLGILFDRSRIAQFLGVGGVATRSPPTLVIPIEWDGGTGLSLEQRTDWQRAWARFRPGGSPIDYVRPVGSGIDPLLLNVAQTGRPGRAWWRGLLDQYAAEDVVIPIVHLTRLWPGGPVVAQFEARHGADRTLIASFGLRIENSAELPRLLDEGVRRIDLAYAQALNEGRLGADPSLTATPIAPENDNASGEDQPVADVDAAAALATGVSDFTVQVETPDAASVSSVEASLRSMPGMADLQVSSLALGGVSVYRMRYSGDIDLLQTALAARGWRAEGQGGTLRLRREAPAIPPPEVTGGAPAAPPAPPGAAPPPPQ